LPRTNAAPTQPVAVKAGTAQTSKRGTSTEATTWEGTPGAAGKTALSASDPAACPEATESIVRPDDECTARNRPSADQQVLDTAPVWPLSVFTSAPFSTLKIFAVRSQEPVARYLPHGEKLTDLTPLVWPLSVFTSALRSTLKIFAVLSPEPVARYLPHGEKHTDVTLLVWPLSVFTFAPEGIWIQVSAQFSRIQTHTPALPLLHPN